MNISLNDPADKAADQPYNRSTTSSHKKKYKNSARLFADARYSLLGNLRTAVWSQLLYLITLLFLSTLPGSIRFENTALDLAFILLGRFITSLFASLFGIGLSLVFLNLQYGQQASVRNLFHCFFAFPDKAVRVRSFVTAGELLCLLPIQLTVYFIPYSSFKKYLPLVLAAAIVSIAASVLWSASYAMTNFLLLDFPQLDAGRILRASSKIMNGSRLRLIRLFLRLLPLHLLGVFSFGLANLYAGICQNACAAAFYKDLMQKNAPADS